MEAEEVATPGGPPPAGAPDGAARRPKTAWDYVQPRDVARFGSEILDPRLQVQWGRAMFLAGTLPYLWREKVPQIRRAIFDALELRPGDRVFVLGEAIEACGFLDDLRARIGAEGQIHVVEIIDEARDAYFNNVRGPSGATTTRRSSATESSMRSRSSRASSTPTTGGRSAPS
jgi:hypothetical protein